MLELWALVSLFAAVAADAGRQGTLGFSTRSHTFPLLSQRLRADEVWSAGGRTLRTGRPTSGFTYFASGSSRPAHIQGFAAIGHPIGVVAGELSPAGVEELIRLAHMQLDVFVDSGAFNEMRSGVEPDWDAVVATYQDLSGPIGEWLHVVAPDKIADQRATLERMRRYGPAMIRIAETGAEVFVPLQGGEISLAEFEELALEAMGVPPHLLRKFVPALPLKAAHLPIRDVLDYVTRWRPTRLHLLGLGPKRRPYKGRPGGEELIRLLRAASPYTEISLDSAVIPATAGLTGGPGGGPRVLGGAREYLRREGMDPGELQRYSIPVAWPDQHAAAEKAWGPRGREMIGVPEQVREAQKRYEAIWAEQVTAAGGKKGGDDYGVEYGTYGW